MLSILRTIAIIDIATNAVLAAVAWLFGMTVTQTLGAGLVALIVIVVVLGWRAVVNAPHPSPKLRTDWQHLSADHVDRLPTPRAVAEIVAPQTKELDHVVVHQPRISSASTRAITAPPNHRQRRAAD